MCQTSLAHINSIRNVYHSLSLCLCFFCIYCEYIYQRASLNIKIFIKCHLIFVTTPYQRAWHELSSVKLNIGVKLQRLSAIVVRKFFFFFFVDTRVKSILFFFFCFSSFSTLQIEFRHLYWHSLSLHLCVSNQQKKKIRIKSMRFNTRIRNRNAVAFGRKQNIFFSCFDLIRSQNHTHAMHTAMWKSFLKFAYFRTFYKMVQSHTFATALRLIYGTRAWHTYTKRI